MWRKERATIWKAVGKSKEKAIRRPNMSFLQKAWKLTLNLLWITLNG
jgi:hypothetical protein